MIKIQYYNNIFKFDDGEWIEFKSSINYGEATYHWPDGSYRECYIAMNGLINGYAKEYKNHGKNIQELNFIDGVLFGPATETIDTTEEFLNREIDYDMSIEYCNYENNDKVGDAKIEYYCDKKLIRIINFKYLHNKRNGEGKTIEFVGLQNFWGENNYNKIVSKYNYINGILTGKCEIIFMYDEDVISTVDCSYENGQLNGKGIQKYILYDEYRVFNFVNGVREGKTTYYFNTGNITEAIFENGVLVGKAITYFPNGGRREFYYKNGIEEGEGFEYYPDKTVEKFSYFNGVKEGIVRFITEGKGMCRGIYHDGKLDIDSVEVININGKYKEYTFINSIYYYNDIGEFNKKNATGKAITYFPNGGRREFYYKNGLEQGVGIEYYPGGTIEKFTYVDGIKNGLAKLLRKDGSIDYGVYDNGYFKLED